MILNLLWSFFKIGLFTFGGGYAMIPLIQREIIDIHGWLTLPEFLDVIAIAEMTPGPIAINSATFVGYRTAGVTGAIAATLGVVLPSFIVVIGIVLLFNRIQKNPRVQAGSKGIRSAVVALIALAVWSLGREVVHGPIEIALALASFAVAHFLKWNPILILGIAGVAGALLLR